MIKSKYYFFSFTIFTLIIICIFIRDNIYIVQSNSMENMLFPGDVIFVNKSKKIKMYPERDDIYLFTSNRKNIPSIKRIIGKPNDTIYLWNENIYINGNLYLNPSTVKHKYWIKNRKSKKFSSTILVLKRNLNDTILTQLEVHTFESNNLDIASFEFELITDSIFLDNAYFMVGDNRHFSIDSRHFGAIKKDDIIGKAVFIIFNVGKPKVNGRRFFKKLP